MLRPADRNLLLEAMRPPEGYSMDHAIGTTFTLDLLSLLVTPLAFTFFDWEDREGRPTANPLALLEALRRHAERIHLFCQVGMINVPPPDKRLLNYLEGSVFEVRAPRRGGLFHPKVWLLRFVSKDDEPVVYRLLCLSRNLTFARSWDTVLVLDGELAGRKRAFAKNHPLGEFIEALPGMVTGRRLRGEIRDTVTRMADEVRRVKFHPPDTFDDYAFWPVGIDRRYAWPFPQDGRDFLVMSPFLGEGFLERLQLGGKVQHLISRPESLAQLTPESLEGVGECLVMDSGAELDALDGDMVDAHDSDAIDDTSAPATSPAATLPAETGAGPRLADAELSGLHAKLFMMDDGWHSRLWTGSANATDAAFNNNIEFLVELHGKKRSKIGAFLGSEDDPHTLRALLVPYVPTEPPAEPPEEARKLLSNLNAGRERIIDLALQAVIEKTDEDTFSITLKCGRKNRWTPPPHVIARAWPITLQVSEELTAEEPTAARFTSLSFEALTAFFAFEVAIAANHNLKGRDKVEPLRFVLRLPLNGEPADRKERILQSLLHDQDQVMRLLLLLLAGEGISAADFVGPGHEPDGGAGSFARFGTATLLESLLNALDRDPYALDQVHRIISDLRKTPEGQKLIPEDFDEIWEPIWQARNEGAT